MIVQHITQSIATIKMTWPRKEEAPVNQVMITILILKEEMRASLEAQCEEPTCQCRGHWLDPWSGKISHALEQINPCATYHWAHTLQLTRPAHPEPVRWEAWAPQPEESPPAPTREKACAAMKTHHSHKSINNFFKKMKCVRVSYIYVCYYIHFLLYRKKILKDKNVNCFISRQCDYESSNYLSCAKI